MKKKWLALFTTLCSVAVVAGLSACESLDGLMSAVDLSALEKSSSYQQIFDSDPYSSSSNRWEYTPPTSSSGKDSSSNRWEYTPPTSSSGKDSSSNRWEYTPPTSSSGKDSSSNRWEYFPPISSSIESSSEELSSSIESSSEELLSSMESSSEELSSSIESSSEELSSSMESSSSAGDSSVEEEIICTVSFDGNGGSTPDDITVTVGSAYGNLPVSTREGYTFVGWFTHWTEGTEITSESVLSDKVNRILLYAHWVEEVIVEDENIMYTRSGDAYSVAGVYDTTVTEVVIPKKHDGLPVTRIDYYAFSDCTRLESITIPETVVEIREYAFEDCKALQTITVAKGNEKFRSVGNCLIDKVSKTLLLGCNGGTIPDDGSVEIIGAFAFSELNMTSVVIPDPVKIIEVSAFSNCSNLTSVTLGENVTEIKDSAFSNCYNLTSVTLGENVTEIKDSAFSNCDLTEITIPASVTYIGENAFSGCYDLKNVYITDLTAWCKIEFKGNPLSAYRGGDLYVNGEIVEELVIPEGITEIKSRAFYGCKSITSVTMLDTVTSVGKSAFSDCDSLVNVDLSNGVERIGEYAFSGCDSLRIVRFSNQLKRIGNHAFSDCNSLINIDLPSSLECIEYWAFEDCSRLINVSVGKDTYIEWSVFEGCSRLTNVYFKGTPEDSLNVDSIGNELLTSANLYYYSETKPTDTEHDYWYYLNGEFAIW